jgi:hypothetical protein
MALEVVMNKEICILNGTKWILGDESTEPMNWEDANNWCKSIGQDLPPREVLLMAFLNPEIRSKFANAYYWSSSEFDSYSAWDQDFNIGDQNVNFSKSAKLSVRAVRAIIAEASEQTEQEPLLIETKIEWYGKGFRQGVNEFAPPKPLTEDVIYALDKEGVVENMDDHQVRYVIRWIRRVEKAHGIGGGNE